jgi:hypothetical protein
MESILTSLLAAMECQIDSRNSDIVYTGFQSNYLWLNRETNNQTYIQPKHELGENPYRFTKAH